MEKLAGFKYHPPGKFSDEGDGIRAMHHIYCHHRFPAGLVAIRRIPCHCQGCRNQIKKEWVTGLEPKKQPRFQMNDDCRFVPWGDRRVFS